MFQEIEIRKLGDYVSDPVQVMVKDGYIASNLIDVGYGVSQALPVAVESIIAPEHTRLLIQQPEVHLHPRAQAALGSLFARLAGSHGKQFVVETHSDFIMDRVRTEVAKGTISAQDVIILYLEKEQGKTTVYPIEIGETGGILNPPPSYRSFFMEETFDVLSRTGV